MRRISTQNTFKPSKFAWLPALITIMFVLVAYLVAASHQPRRRQHYLSAPIVSIPAVIQGDATHPASPDAMQVGELKAGMVICVHYRGDYVSSNDYNITIDDNPYPALDGPGHSFHGHFDGVNLPEEEFDTIPLGIEPTPAGLWRQLQYATPGPCWQPLPFSITT